MWVGCQVWVEVHVSSLGVMSTCFKLGVRVFGGKGEHRIENDKRGDYSFRRRIQEG